jgi:hypothetical protein
MNNKNISNEILNLVKNLSIKFDNLSIKFDNLSIKVDNIENDILIIKKDIKSLKDHRTEVKSYQKINSKEYEKEMTNWLFHYLINNNYSLHFYIPSNKEFPRDILNVNNINQKIKTVTDLDGVIIGTTINPLHKKNSNITENKIYILEAKHNFTIAKIKKKIKQVIKLYKIINNPNSSLNLQKYKNSPIYLYFSSPLLKKEIYEFISKKEYLLPKIWENDKNEINISELNYIADIYIISNNSGEYKIMNNYE